MDGKKKSRLTTPARTTTRTTKPSKPQTSNPSKLFHDGKYIFKAVQTTPTRYEINQCNLELLEELEMNSNTSEQNRNNSSLPFTSLSHIDYSQLVSDFQHTSQVDLLSINYADNFSTSTNELYVVSGIGERGYTANLQSEAQRGYRLSTMNINNNAKISIHIAKGGQTVIFEHLFDITSQYLLQLLQPTTKYPPRPSATRTLQIEQQSSSVMIRIENVKIMNGPSLFMAVAWCSSMYFLSIQFDSNRSNSADDHQSTNLKSPLLRYISLSKYPSHTSILSIQPITYHHLLIFSIPSTSSPSSLLLFNSPPTSTSSSSSSSSRSDHQLFTLFLYYSEDESEDGPIVQYRNCSNGGGKEQDGNDDDDIDGDGGEDDDCQRCDRFYVPPSFPPLHFVLPIAKSDLRIDDINYNNNNINFDESSNNDNDFGCGNDQRLRRGGNSDAVWRIGGDSGGDDDDDDEDDDENRYIVCTKHQQLMLLSDNINDQLTDDNDNAAVWSILLPSLPSSLEQIQLANQTVIMVTYDDDNNNGDNDDARSGNIKNNNYAELYSLNGQLILSIIPNRSSPTSLSLKHRLLHAKTPPPSPSLHHKSINGSSNNSLDLMVRSLKGRVRSEVNTLQHQLLIYHQKCSILNRTAHLLLNLTNANITLHPHLHVNNNNDDDDEQRTSQSSYSIYDKSQLEVKLPPISPATTKITPLDLLIDPHFITFNLHSLLSPSPSPSPLISASRGDDDDDDDYILFASSSSQLMNGEEDGNDDDDDDGEGESGCMMSCSSVVSDKSDLNMQMSVMMKGGDHNHPHSSVMIHVLRSRSNGYDWFSSLPVVSNCERCFDNGNDGDDDGSDVLMELDDNRDERKEERDEVALCVISKYWNLRDFPRLIIGGDIPGCKLRLQTSKHEMIMEIADNNHPLRRPLCLQLNIVNGNVMFLRIQHFSYSKLPISLFFQKFREIIRSATRGSNHHHHDDHHSQRTAEIEVFADIIRSNEKRMADITKWFESMDRLINYVITWNSQIPKLPQKLVTRNRLFKSSSNNQQREQPNISKLLSEYYLKKAEFVALLSFSDKLFTSMHL